MIAARARRGGRPRDRLDEPDRVRGASGRRPAGAPARHHARAAAPRVGARGRAGRRPHAHARLARPGRRPLRRAASLSLAAVVVAVALLVAPTADASRYIQKGIYDDAQILYGNPDKVFPLSRRDRHEADPRQPLVGRGQRRRHAATDQPGEPRRSRLRLGHLRPHRPLCGRLRRHPDLHDRRHAGLGECRQGLERRARRTPST